jgi:hypothetical protein
LEEKIIYEKIIYGILKNDIRSSYDILHIRKLGVGGIYEYTQYTPLPYRILKKGGPLS